MKRRKFVQNLLAAPAVAPLAAQTQQRPSAQPNAQARQTPQQPQEIASLAVTEVDLVAATPPHYFTADQFSALQKLAAVLVPPLKGKPGAVDAHAPEFLDFLISVSPAERQSLYRNGLESLNRMAQDQFHTNFHGLEAKQADAIIRPLLVARYWPQDMPEDPLKNFMAQIHEDLRTATANSREWAEGGSSSPSGGRVRRFNRGRGLYWRPIDPVVRG
jgi:gluconate 2-dehydrogenase subunit 3-like protein